MVNSPIKYSDLGHEVYFRLKEMILEEQLKPGEKLKQEQIASLLGVSRMPLHKAFQMLEDELLIESIPRRGYYVRKINTREIIDAFECREAIEGVAARRAAENMSDSQVAGLKKLFIPFLQQDNIEETRKYQQADQKFHALLLEYSDNQVLKKIAILGNVLIRTYQKGMVRDPRETIKEHMAIIDAFEKRDKSLAEGLIKEHLHKSILILKQTIEDETN